MAQADTGVETLSATLKKAENMAISDSVEIIARDVIPLKVIVPLSEKADGNGRLSLLVSRDNQGKSWAHFYADMDSAGRSLQQGTNIATMDFPDAFRMIAGNDDFGGFRLESGEQWTLMPREYFSRIEKMLPAKTQ
ncbi:MAG: hypothetical protein AB7U38_14825 [Hyphomicrobiales bacterium]